MEKETHLVVGHRGEVGAAVWLLLRKKFIVEGLDHKVNFEPEGKFNFIHICIPYGDSFIQSYNKVRERYLSPNGIIIIHSTVPVGTSSSLGAVHSPIRGLHPNLLGGLRTFTKFFGGARSIEAAVPFEELNLHVHCHSDARTTEALKLWSTEQYKRDIETQKEIHAYCEKHNLPFDIVYSAANDTYNKGYAALEKPHFRRPILVHQQGPIGGHCVLPNHELLKKSL